MTEALDPLAPGEPAAAAPDPSLAPDWESQARPVVAASTRPRDGWLIVGGAVMLGLLVMFWLGARRSAEAATATSTPRSSSAYVTAPPTPADVASFAATAPSSSAPTAQAVPAAATPSAAVLTPASFSSGPSAAEAAAAARLKAPALVVDLGDQAPTSQASAPPPASGGPGSTVAAGSPSSGAGLNSDEQFAHRVGSEEPDHAVATRIENLRDTIPQGAMIPGVMETALDSDLPGYARAVVSRDVRGFDGSAVLIPRGSRVIGEYKSAAAQGQSRAFVVWTRIIRPDGVSIQIGSSGTDPLGRAGLAGSVNRHIIEQYGGAILLSVLDAGVTSLSRQPATQVVIGSATSTGTTGIVPADISPTIKVKQGAPIRIFVARDLDFSSAGAVGG